MNKDELNRKKRELERELREIERMESQSREESMKTIRIDPDKTVRQKAPSPSQNNEKSEPLTRGKKTLYIFFSVLFTAVVVRSLIGISLIQSGYNLDAKTWDGNIGFVMTINFLITSVILASLQNSIRKWSHILGISVAVYAFQLSAVLISNPLEKIEYDKFEQSQDYSDIAYEHTPEVEIESESESYTPSYQSELTPIQSTPSNSSSYTEPVQSQPTSPSTRKTTKQPKEEERADANAPGYYLYKTFFVDYALEPILRAEATPYGKELYRCPKNADVYVLNTNQEAYYFVSVNQRRGYISKALLRGVNATRSNRSKQTTPSSPESYVPQIYTYKTSFNSKTGSPVMLEKPKSGSRVLYNLDKNDPVYVIERTNSQYYRVVVDGKRGYVSKYTLNQK